MFERSHRVGRAGRVSFHALALLLIVSVIPAAGRAQGIRANAIGSVSIEEPVGTTLAYDIMRQLQTAIFPTGSCFERASSADLAQRAARAGIPVVARGSCLGRQFIPSDDAVSVGIQTFYLPGIASDQDAGRRTILVLAQFN